VPATGVSAAGVLSCKVTYNMPANTSAITTPASISGALTRPHWRRGNNPRDTTEDTGHDILVCMACTASVRKNWNGRVAV